MMSVRILRNIFRRSILFRYILFILIILIFSPALIMIASLFIDSLKIPPGGLRIHICGANLFHYPALSNKEISFPDPPRSFQYTIGDAKKIRPPLFHDESEFCTDRIMNQIKFMEEYSSQLRDAGELSQLPILTFLAMHNTDSVSLGNIGPGSKKFAGCPIDRCQVIGDASQVDNADVLLWDNSPFYPRLRKPRNPAQIWFAHFYESAYSTPDLRDFRDQLNLTGGFRLDSDIPVPYDSYYPLKKPLDEASFASRDWSAGKTGTGKCLTFL